MSETHDDVPLFFEKKKIQDHIYTAQFKRIPYIYYCYFYYRCQLEQEERKVSLKKEGERIEKIEMGAFVLHWPIRAEWYI